MSLPERRRTSVTEKTIERSILDFLRWKRVFAFKVENGGVFDEKRKAFRFSAMRTRGIADIIGVYKGRPLAIEVKTPTGRLSDHQKIFLSDWSSAGGVAVVARSVDDVLDLIAEIDLQLGDSIGTALSICREEGQGNDEI